jgi:hypothetical protein
MLGMRAETKPKRQRLGFQINSGRKSKRPFRILQKGRFRCLSGDPAGIRTQDPYIKSVLLYQLSYGIFLLSLQPWVVSLNCDAKVGQIF